MKNKVYILLDRSGSMASMWETTLESINGYVSNLKENPRVQLSVFDSNNEIQMEYLTIRDAKVKKWQPINKLDVFPRGGTPLNDALARTFQTILAESPKNGIVVVMTDGFENSSTQFSKEHVKNLMKVVAEKKYQVVFLGANFDQIDKEASSYGSQSSRNINFTPENMKRGWELLSNKTNQYYDTSCSATMDWSDNEKESMSSNTIIR